MMGAGLFRSFAALLSQLAASTGSSLVGFVQSGAGAVATNLQAKLREIITVDVDFGADRTGAASCVAAFQAAMTELAARGGGRLRIRSGTYLFNLASDADTILIPSNVVIECEAGVVFKWGYWGSPLFAIVNKTNVRLALNGALFVWSGNFGATAGSRDAFGYGRAIPAYEWCSHICSVGSSNVVIEHAGCQGATTANNQNNFLHFRGTAAGGLTSGNKVRYITANDVCQGCIWGEQDQFEIDISADRYATTSAGLYGPGHVLYIIAGAVPSQNGRVRVFDKAGTMLSAYAVGAHSVSLKSLQNVQATIYSERAEGAVNFQDATDLAIDVRYRSAVGTADTGAGSVYGVNPTTGNKFVKIKASIIFDAQRNAPTINLGGIAASASNLHCEIDADIVMTCDGTESTPAISWVGDKGFANVRYLNKGAGGARVIVSADKGSTDNNFWVNARGSVPNPRVSCVAGVGVTGNTFFCSGDYTVDYDSNEFAPGNGNAVIWQGSRSYQSMQNLGNVTNPAPTIQLPMPGAYLLWLNLISSDRNHSRAGLFLVVFDDASVNDYQAVQLEGTEITKGGSAPTALSASVSNAGLVTVSSTAAANTWLLNYGYRQLSQD